MTTEIRSLMDQHPKRKFPPDVSQQILASRHVIYCLNCMTRMRYTGVWTCSECGAKVSAEKKQTKDPVPSQPI